METFPRYWPFVRGIHRWPANSPLKGQWGGALMFSLICAWINGWVNNREAGDLRRHRTHYDATVMWSVFHNQPITFYLGEWRSYAPHPSSDKDSMVEVFMVDSDACIYLTRGLLYSRNSHWHRRLAKAMYEVIQVSMSLLAISFSTYPLQWRHNERDGVSNHQPHDCLLKRLFKRRSKNIKAPRHWLLWGEFIVDRWIPHTIVQ